MEDPESSNKRDIDGKHWEFYIFRGPAVPVVPWRNVRWAMVYCYDTLTMLDYLDMLSIVHNICGISGREA